MIISINRGIKQGIDTAEQIAVTVYARLECCNDKRIIQRKNTQKALVEINSRNGYQYRGTAHQYKNKNILF